MATRFSSALLADNSTDANFRAWAQFIEDTLVTTGGWVVTSDTGQTAPASLAHPTTGNTKQGYRIYRMNDSLQSTYPVFMRIDFGSYTGVNTPAFWVTIGTGSSGTGTITGILWNGGALTNAPVAGGNSVSANNSYGSAATGRASMGLFVTASGTFGMMFTIERTKSSAGADTGDGLLLVYSDAAVSAGNMNTSRYIIYAVGGQPTAEAGLSYILTRMNPTETFTPGDVGVGVIIHFKGVAQQPGMNVVITNSNDVAAEGSFSISIYGASRIYQNLNAGPKPYKALAGAGTLDNNARVNIRYD
jgi:hypothetical protein